MKLKCLAFMLILGLFIGLMPAGVQAAYNPPASYGAPENVGVSFDFSTEDNWRFIVGYGASKGIRDIVKAYEDGSFEENGFYNLSIGVQVDYKLDNGQWKSEYSGYDELPSGTSWFSAEEGKFTDGIELRYYEFEDYFTDGILPGGQSYFDTHTMYFRLRFCVDYGDENDDYEYYSPWSDTASYSSQQVEDPAVLINHAPVLKSAEIRKYDDGEPYLFLTAERPHDDILKLNSISSQGVRTNVWIKVGSGEWKDNGTYGVGMEGFEVEIDDYFDSGTTSFDAFVYDVKFRYEFDCDNYPAVEKTGTIYSPFSNVISHGMPAYSHASSWAVAELDKAAQYGFITDRIKDKMDGPITREEFCEIVVRFVEKLAGSALTYQENPFSDTSNPEILKAYQSGIVKGIGQGKFAPNNLVTRQEIAVMMLRAIKLHKPQDDFSVEGVSRFSDEASIASWALDAVRFMFKNGIIKGPGDGSIGPLENTTREQAVLMVVRTFEKYMESN